MKTKVRRIPLYLLGLAISVLPALIATILYFPVWQSRGTYAQISGIALCLMLIAIVPLLRHIKRRLSSPSVPLIWFVIFILFFSLSKICEQVTVISFVGFISNLIAIPIFKMSLRKDMTQDENEA